MLKEDKNDEGRHRVRKRERDRVTGRERER
jgi:hypothetical protein